MKILFLLILLCLFICCQCQTPGYQEEEPWTGRWLPERISPTVSPDSLNDKQHGIKMGVSSVFCDDAKSNLTVDWDLNPINYTCFGKIIEPNYDISPIIEKEVIPPFYVAQHKCMNESIEYESVIPTFGTHRPLWPRYGEYKFVPKQRWIHNLEHGGLVMLYHPCAHPIMVDKLRRIVRGCLYRHIITPYNLLDHERPIALVTWGTRMTMSTINTALVKEFIKSRALKGPEKLSRNGQFDLGLIFPANIISTIEDISICPNPE